MSTENETWRDASSSEENSGAGRDGNQFNREGSYSRPSYNRENGDRPYRPRFNSENGDRPQRSYSSDRPYRQRFNPNAENGDRPQRSYNNDRSYRPRYNGESGDRPQRSYGNNAGGDRPYRPRYNSEGGDRPQRSYGNNTGGDRPYRPRYNSEGGDRPQRPYGNNAGGDRPYRPRYNSEGGDRPQRPYGNNAGGDRPFRPRYNSNGDRPQRPYGNRDSYREVVTELGTKIKRGDEVKFHDQTVSIERKIYVLLNKPKDTVTTSDDPQARRTVMDLVKGACDERIYPVGRLDRNTTGVLLLTNDGDLASKLTHPKYLKKKIYHVHLDKNLTKADMEQIAAGIQLDDGEIQADAISYTDDFKKDEVGIEIHSGKNRIVRRIFESLGYKVVKLDRVFFAGLTKKGLRRGEWRYLTEQEVNFLRMGSFE